MPTSISPPSWNPSAFSTKSRFILPCKKTQVMSTIFCQFFFFRTLRSTLHVWLDAFPEDFRDPPDYQLLNQFLDFCERQAKDTELHFKVKHRMERLIKNPENHLSSLPILDRSSPSSKRILNHHNSELSFSPDAASSPAGLLKNGRSSSLGNGLSLSLCPADLNESGLHAAFLEMSERLMAEQLTRFDTVILLSNSYFYIVSFFIANPVFV